VADVFALGDFWGWHAFPEWGVGFAPAQLKRSFEEDGCEEGARTEIGMELAPPYEQM